MRNFFHNTFVKYFNEEKDLDSSDYLNNSYSQEGEDLILRRYFNNKHNGFYVDIGAYHPFRFSNTFMFYQMGWKGINIDATPGSMDLFRKYRPRDINIEAAISDKVKKLTFNIFNEPALNTFSLSKKQIITKNSEYILKDKIIIQTKKINSIFDKYLNKDNVIDFINIDIEGMDYSVLNSINWKKYKPKIILVEDKEFVINNAEKSKIFRYLIKNSYKIIAKTFNTCFYSF